MSFINDVTNNIIEKLAARAWKKNWGSLSPVSEQRLKDSGIWNPEKEYAGYKKGLDNKLVNYMSNDPSLDVQYTRPPGLAGAFTPAMLRFDPNPVPVSIPGKNTLSSSWILKEQYMPAMTQDF